MLICGPLLVLSPLRRWEVSPDFLTFSEQTVALCLLSNGQGCLRAVVWPLLASLLCDRLTTRTPESHHSGAEEQRDPRCFFYSYISARFQQGRDATSYMEAAYLGVHSMLCRASHQLAAWQEGCGR